MKDIYIYAYARLFFTTSICRLIGSDFSVILEDENQVEVSFTNKWDAATWNSSGSYWRLPVNVDRRYYATAWYLKKRVAYI